jgi:putative methyltransferase
MIQFVPYAYGFLRSYAEQNQVIKENYTWKEPFCRVEPINTLVGKIIDPDLLFLSCYVWNFNQQMEIAKRVRQLFPACRVVCGGPHIPNDSTGFFEQFPMINILVHGEGEIPVSNLLLELLNDRPDLSKIRGITYLDTSQAAVQTKESEKLPKNLPVPSPYLTGLFTPFFTSEDKANKIALWETNRGCPFSCCFCDWGVRTVNKVRQHHMDRVKEEIQYFGTHKIEDIYISDSNFGLFERDLEIAQGLVACKEKFGYPKRVRIQFAKKSNNTVLEISRLLFENNMLWGTTLSMQSVDMNVLEAIKRPRVSIDSYKAAKKKYKEYNIPTYTELILGLPRETKESFIKGICTLFDIDMHDDFRTFELVLLPNAPLAQPGMREKYGLLTRFKPMRLADGGCKTEYLELVFGTNTMSEQDWEDCFVFSEMAQALHNGGYTRFLSIYLSKTNTLSYLEFYSNFFTWMMGVDELAFAAFSRIKRLIHDFYEDPAMPQINRALTQPDMAQFLASFNPDRKGWQLWIYIWLWISEHKKEFYLLVTQFLKDQGNDITPELTDLIKYQEEIMLSLDYDPGTGKVVSYDYNWDDYFMKAHPLKKELVHLHYHDTHMGASFQYDLEKNNQKKFVTAAIGFSYPYSKFRHFFHQSPIIDRNGWDKAKT